MLKCIMINLLPSQEKKELKSAELWRLVSILGNLLLLFLIFNILIFFSIKVNIQSKTEQRNVLVELEKKEMMVPEVQQLRERVKTTNDDILKLNYFYQGQISLIEIFQKIAKILPQGAYLNSLSYQQASSQISLSGFCPTQKDLFEFKKDLERQEEFSDIYFPLFNWIQQTDIDFQVTFKIASEQSEEK
ncbi:PilN domain-containing protein [Patescibacteria group bacterium]